ncbi:squalene/phytoene synthase family protein [Streptomyces sp. NPDC047024]|uniref:squalene/phytoene synthase family protein n=1 Tax=Streptomyces sp. NPDC047024 TaxID=3155476 RepID=UPI0033E533A0
MSTWTKSLDAAGIRDARLRDDYGAQRQLVKHSRSTAYLAARWLLPRPVLPHVLAATAVMEHGDNLLDTGPLPDRQRAWQSWEERIRKALDTGDSDDPLIRTLVHTITTYPRLRETTETYLATAPAELSFTGFTTESDYQSYLDDYSLPAFLLIGTLLGPQDDDAPFRAACRTFIEGAQRLDFVNDLAEDLREGRIGIPTETLTRFSLAADDLAKDPDPSALRELVDHEVVLARTSLEKARELPELAPSPHRRLLRTLIEVELLTADAVSARGARLLNGSASPSRLGMLRLLLRGR